VNVCGIVLAAGEGTRLRPLTGARPKALCPVGNVPLLDRALALFAALGLTGPDAVAVNACYLAGQVVDHVGDRAHLSVEAPPPMGTSGGVANLAGWIDGRDVLVLNADAYLPDPGLDTMLDGWDGERVRLLGVPKRPQDGPGGFGPYRFAGCSLLPWPVVRDLPREPAELVRTAWRPAEAAGRLEVRPYPGHYLDTGTPHDYLAANLHAAGYGNLVDPTATVTGTLHGAVVGAGATVHGRLTRVVVWPGGHVAAGEDLTDAIRAEHDLTVPAEPYR